MIRVPLTLLMLCMLAACATRADGSEPSPAAGGASPTSAASATPAAASACPAGAEPPAGADSAPAAGVSYDPQANIIRLRGAQPATIAGVAAALGRTDLLRETAPGEWLLAANLQIDRGAELRVAGPQVRWLKLRSDQDGFVWVKALGGTLTFSDTCVSSWDPVRQALDERPGDGRSYVLARDGATMNIRHSVMHYLGYMADESYGVAYRLAGTSGEVVDSDLSYNYYGLYAYQVAGLKVRNSDVHHNLRYGIDPHTDSTNLLIEGNRAYANGKHGIILAERCSNSIIRGNLTYDNALHGIVIYDASDGNLVEGNSSYGNGLQGINVNNSNHNTLRDNTVYANGEDGIGVGQGAEDNLIAGNTVRDNKHNGVYVYSEATGTTIASNLITDNGRYGIYVKSRQTRITNGNTIRGNQVGVYLNTDDPPLVSLERNTITGNAEGAVREH